MTMHRILTEGRAFIGSPDTVEQQIRRTFELFGDVEPSLQMLFGNLPYDVAERSLRLFASEVMPRFSGAPASVSPERR
jgi:alkanesulfonate monooxygenase SsuD/methylene tetrahydromethanopterin reductase-like flavin-dependent oxidoreductase (luciferase family)